MGLMGRRTVGADEGLLLPGTSSIHMFFMRTAIDCLFLAPPDGEGQQRVVDLRRPLRPGLGVVWYVRGARIASSSRPVPSSASACAAGRWSGWSWLPPLESVEHGAHRLAAVGRGEGQDHAGQGDEHQQLLRQPAQQRQHQPHGRPRLARNPAGTSRLVM